MRRVHFSLLMTFAGLLVGLAGCESTGSAVDVHSWRKGLESDNRMVRMEAVTLAAKAPRDEAVPALIARLGDIDDVVRAMAYQGLIDATGQTFPFDPVADPFERRRQIAQWRTWWADQTRADAPEAK